MVARPRHPSDTPREQLTALAAECERYSPLVSLEPRETPESLWLDVTGIGPLFGGELELARAALEHFSARGYSSRAAIASTPGAAWALAHAEARARNGTTEAIVPLVAARESLAHRLHSLPLKFLRLDSATLELLGTLGLEHLGQLLALPRAGLATRFGPELLLRVDQLLGDVAEPLVPYRPRPMFAVERAFEDPVEGSEWIALVLEELSAALAQQLLKAGQGALQLEVRLDAAGHAPLYWRVGLYRPAASARHFLELLRLPLENSRGPSAVGRIGLSAPLVGRLEEEQAELFAGSKRRAARQLEHLIDRLASRLGAQRVLGARERYDPLPECALEFLSLVGRALAQRTAKAQSSRSATSASQSFSPRIRPLRLLPEPRPLRVVALAPEGLPMQFELAGRARRVLRHWGPERLETGWWRGPSQRRDYFRVETTTGERYWLFRSLATRHWFLHGIFA